MSQNEHIHHEINYIELSAIDIADAKRFYNSAFGWQFNDYGPDYVGIRKQQADGECGGICRVEQITKGGPLVILYSRDLEASYSSVEEAGGTISKDIISFPGGRRFSVLRSQWKRIGCVVRPDARHANRRRITKTCTGVAGRAESEIIVTWPPPGDVGSLCGKNATRSLETRLS